MNALGRFIVFVTLLLGAAGICTAFAFTDSPPVSQNVTVSTESIEGVGTKGWPAVVSGVLLVAVWLLRSRTPASHWLHSKGGTATLTGVTGLLAGIGMAVQRHGLSWEVVTSAFGTGALALLVVTKPEKKPQEGKLEVKA